MYKHTDSLSLSLFLSLSPSLSLSFSLSLSLRTRGGGKKWRRNFMGELQQQPLCTPWGHLSPLSCFVSQVTRERARESARARERERAREQGTGREGCWGWEGKRKYFDLVAPSFPHHLPSQIEEGNGNGQRGTGRRRRASDQSGASRCPPPA